MAGEAQSGQVVVFFSYARSDDAYSNNLLSYIRKRLEDEIRYRSGNEGYEVFQDTDDIALGESWREALGRALDRSHFLIPIMSPKYFASEACQAELKHFLSRETADGRSESILPIYWLSAPVLEAQDGEPARELASRQYDDWRQFSRAKYDQSELEHKIQELALIILARMEASESPPPARRLEGDGLPSSAREQTRLQDDGLSAEQDRSAPVALMNPVLMPSKIDTGWHPLVSGVPPTWASGWGQDEFGVFTDFTFADVTQRLRWCRPGLFLLGSPPDEEGRFDDEGPQVEVIFSEGFWLFETAVSQALYSAVMGDNPSHFEGDDRPVEQVSWKDAVTFIDRLNSSLPGLDLRLPSEAEWEYACRAGSTTPFDPKVAAQFSGRTITPDEVNYDGNEPFGEAPKGEDRGETVPVKAAGFHANNWGFWHMHGNVYEWCADVWHESHEDASPVGAARRADKQDGERDRVVRGGSWIAFARFCRAAYRVSIEPGNRIRDLGFRPARGPVMSSSVRSGGPEGPGQSLQDAREAERSADAKDDRRAKRG